MGLDVSHGCWNGPYSAFMRFRGRLAEVAWGVKDLYAAYQNEDTWRLLKKAYGADLLFKLIDHSDSDGEIITQDQLSLAARLEELSGQLIGGPNDMVRGIAFSDAAINFAKGLRAANAAAEAVRFG